MKIPKIWTLYAVMLLVVLLFFCGSSSTANECISADQAWNKIGETACVEYYVSSPFESRARNVFLNEKRDYKKGFTTVIFASARNNFPPDPVKEYGYKTIRVTGKIKKYEGHPEIVAEHQNQIVIKK